MSQNFSLFKKIKGFLARQIRQNNQNQISKALKDFCDWYLQVYWNEKYWNIEKNGELLVIKKVAEYFQNSQQFNVFDIGANSGEYTQNIIKIHPNSKVHCFEIIPKLASQLEEQFNQNPDIIVNNFGLSNKQEALNVHFFPNSITEARIHSRKNINCVLIECNVTRGDEYLKKNKIDYVHLIKIDTEGHEKFIIQGLDNALNNESIGVIQFEYGRTYLSSRSQLYDIYEFLEPKGFKIGRLFPTGIMFKNYELLHDEHFRMGNYIAVHKNHDSLIEQLNLS
ncbi:MAG: FkbM family methyltransferase [Prochloraceae cyanobacterium]